MRISPRCGLGQACEETRDRGLPTPVLADDDDERRRWLDEEADIAEGVFAFVAGCHDLICDYEGSPYYKRGRIDDLEKLPIQL